MQVREIMTHELDGIEADASLVQAAMELKRKNRTWLPVFSDGKVIGSIRSHDIVIQAVAEKRDCVTTMVRDIMTDIPAYCCEDDDVEEAARKMQKLNMRHLLVVNEESWIVGVLALSDIAKDRDGRYIAGEVLRKTHREG